ncbi:protein YecV [Escherichia coli]
MSIFRIHLDGNKKT